MTEATEAEMTATASVGADDVQELSHLMPALWRTLIRATKGSDRLPALESQVSILRRLVASGPMSPAQLADDLHLARSTISNLIKGLAADGIVAREPSATDGRSVWLVPTEKGREILEAFRRGRAEVLAEALAELPMADRQTINDSLASFEVLLHQLEQMSGGEPV
jgi:DNA-binding MarR family transcriptional regulator